MGKQKKWLASNWHFEMGSYDTSELTTGDDQFNFDFSNVNIGGEAAGTNDLDIWEWRKLVEDGIDTDEPGLPGVIIYSDLNLNGELDTATTEDPLLGFNFMLELEGSTADYQHDYTFQNSQTDMDFII